MPCRTYGFSLGVTLLTFAVNPNLYAQRVHSVGAIGLPPHSSVTFAPPRPAIPPRAGMPVRPAMPMRPGLTVQNHHQAPHRPPEREWHGNGGWHGDGDGDHHRHQPYLYSNYVGYPWLLPFGYGLPFGDDSDDTSSADSVAPAPDFSNEPPAAAPPDVTPAAAPAFRPAYQPQPVEPPMRPEPATTLVFNDGRPPMEVHNYALTGSTLYALDGERRQEIPISALDLPATVVANRKTGVDFALPSSY